MSSILLLCFYLNKNPGNILIQGIIPLGNSIPLEMKFFILEMKIILNKNVKVDEKTLLHKNTEAYVIGISWGENYTDKYMIVIQNKRYTIDKKDANLFEEKSNKL